MGYLIRLIIKKKQILSGFYIGWYLFSASWQTIYKWSSFSKNHFEKTLKTNQNYLTSKSTGYFKLLYSHIKTELRLKKKGRKRERGKGKKKERKKNGKWGGGKKEGRKERTMKRLQNLRKGKITQLVGN